MTFEKLLVAVDGSDHATRALEAAAISPHTMAARWS